MVKKAGQKRFPYSGALWYRPENEEEWHVLRNADVTATDAAALFGVSPYCSFFELYHRKAGNLLVQIDETERMLWGKRLQEVIAQGICDDNGWKLISKHPWLYARSQRFPGMGASPDYVVHCPTRGVGLLEIKNVDNFIARDQWDGEEAPVHIELQLQHQLECADLSWGAIGGLIGGNRTIVIARDRDTEVGIEIGNRVIDLRRRIKDESPPAPDFLHDHSVIKRLYKHAEVGKNLTLDGDAPEVVEVRERLAKLCSTEREANSRMKMAKEDRERAQSEILTIIDDAESVTGLPGFKLRAATQHREERTQIVKATSFRDLRISIERPKAAPAASA